MSKANKLVKELETIKSLSKPTGLAFDLNARLMGSTGKYSALIKPSKVSYHVLRSMSRANSIIRLCIDTLKHQVARQTWAITPIDPDADPEQYKEQIDYLTKLLKRPNKNNETFRTLVEKTIEDINVLDQADWELVRNPKGEICEIYALDGATIRPVYDQYGQYQDPAYLQYLPGNFDTGKPDAEFGMSDLIHMMQNPQNDAWHFGYGFSPVEAVILIATNSLNADMYQGEVFTKGNWSQIILSLGKNASATTLKQFREYWKTDIQGQNYTMPIIGGVEDPKILQLGAVQKDAQYMEYVQWLAKIIIGSFGMSPQDIGLALDQYKAEGEVQQMLSFRKGFSANLDIISEYINQELIWEGMAAVDDKYKEIQFAWTDVDKVNEKERAEVAKMNIEMGAQTVNEYRLEQGLDPIKGGDRAFILTRQGPMYLDSIQDVLDQNKLVAESKATAVTNKPMIDMTPGEQTQKSLEGKNPIKDADVAYIDDDKLPHAFGKEISFIATGERVPRETYQFAKAKFYEAAQLSYGYLDPMNVQKSTGLRPIEITGNLKEAEKRINSRVERDANAIYGVVTHFQKFGQTTQPLYGVYCYENQETEANEYEIQKAVQPLDELVDKYSKILNEKIKKLYPELKKLIVKKSVEDDLSEYADEYSEQTDGDLLIEPDKESESLYNDAIKVALAMGAVSLFNKARTAAQRAKITAVIEKFTPSKLAGFVEQRNMEAAKSVAQTLKDGATKLISGMVDEGKSTDEIAKALKDFLGIDDMWRAKRIARTEINFAAAKASQEQATRAGVAQKKWITGSSNPCPVCEQNAGAGWIGFDENYPSGDMAPTIHPNCSCAEDYKFN